MGEDDRAATSGRPSADALRERLQRRFPDADIVVQDDSHLHAGHAGAAGGAGHYTVRMRARAFEGLRSVARHRLVYDAVGDWMPDRVHALVIHAQAPGEAGGGTAPAASPSH
ncbi:MAG: BolA family protein [Lautropia sp.]